MPPDGVTRRQLLVRGGGAYLVVSGALARSALAEDAIADPLALSGARAATMTAVYGAVAADPGTGLATGVVEDTMRQFGDYYAAAPGALRGYVDDTLDRVESEAAGGFAGLPPEDARAVLRSWSAAGAPDGATGDPHRTLAASALALASFRFEEDELRQVGYTLEPA
ncbi:MAG: hypothetical protein QOE28_493 [Solirubrobacteraceae bacterium]|nr:hypothetical protein [Solirubrobacteraceae bacterium]